MFLSRYNYRSHKSERVERETVEVYTFIGRMVQHVFPKGFQRVRYYRLSALPRSSLSNYGVPVESPH